MPFVYNPVGQCLVVGLVNEQMVTIFTPDEIFLGDFGQVARPVDALYPAAPAA